MFVFRHFLADIVYQQRPKIVTKLWHLHWLTHTSTPTWSYTHTHQHAHM